MKLALVLSLVATSPAFAATHGIGYSDLRDACTNPAKFQNQLAPSNLQISCEEHVSRWLPYNTKAMPLPRSRWIISSLTSDKYTVAPTTSGMPVDQQSGACPSFKETMEVTTFTKATSCDEILGWKGTEQEFCADIVDRARQANPKMVVVKDTGRVVEFCTTNVQQNPGKGEGQDQGKKQQ